MEGSFTCTCKRGYHGDGRSCEGEFDLDGEKPAICEIRMIKSLQVIRNDFFFLFISTDIDECTGGSARCDKDADCKNTDGSYSCSCKPGFLGDGITCTSESS